MLTLDVEAAGGTALSVHHDGTELCRYVHTSDAPQLEAPQPYFHPVRTLAGDLVTLHRPWDHPWHKGISLAMPNVDDANFWGGGMQLLRPDGEIDHVLNNGRQVHDGFDDVGVEDDRVRIVENLHWVTEHDEHWISEVRTIGVRVLPEGAATSPGVPAWVLSFGTTLTNVRGSTIRFGSPTTNGRPEAGYSGFFWRGQRELTHGSILAGGGLEGADVMGKQAPWLAFAGRHDATHTTSTLIFVDGSENLRHPTKWFVRSVPYACVCPSPFFDEVYPLEDGASLRLDYDLVVAAGALDRDAIEATVTGLTSKGTDDARLPR